MGGGGHAAAGKGPPTRGITVFIGRPQGPASASVGCVSFVTGGGTALFVTVKYLF